MRLLAVEISVILLRKEHPDGSGWTQFNAILHCLRRGGFTLAKLDPRVFKVEYWSLSCLSPLMLWIWYVCADGALSLTGFSVEHALIHLLLSARNPSTKERRRLGLGMRHQHGKK